MTHASKSTTVIAGSGGDGGRGTADTATAAAAAANDDEDENEDEDEDEDGDCSGDSGSLDEKGGGGSFGSDARAADSGRTFCHQSQAKGEGRMPQVTVPTRV